MLVEIIVFPSILILSTCKLSFTFSLFSNETSFINEVPLFTNNKSLTLSPIFKSPEILLSFKPILIVEISALTCTKLLTTNPVGKVSVFDVGCELDVNVFIILLLEVSIADEKLL